MVTSCNYEEMTLFLQSGCKTNSLWTFLIISETHHVPPDFEIYVEWYLTFLMISKIFSKHVLSFFLYVGCLWRSPCKIHLWRHSIVLALHYFQGMACYRSATLLEVMDTRSFWIMIVFSRVIYLRSCISEVHSNNSCFSINKKIGGDSSSRTHAF